MTSECLTRMMWVWRGRGRRDARRGETTMTNANETTGPVEEVVALMAAQDTFDALSAEVAKATDTIRALLAIAAKWTTEAE